MRSSEYTAAITINGRRFQVAPVALRGDDTPTITVTEAPAQKSETIEREIVLYNAGAGWGATNGEGEGQYAFAGYGIMHNPGIMRPGIAFEQVPWPVQPLPGSRGSFCEFSSRVSPDRRLVVITARHAYEIDNSLAISAVDMGANFTLQRGMSKAVAFANPQTNGTYLYVARPSSLVTDPMVERTPTGTWQVSPNGKYAEAIGAGKDAVGADVLWRVDANGRLNQAVAGSHPSTPGSWQSETASAPIGPTIAYTNDILQLGRHLVVARSDGFVTYDALANAVPITRGHEQAQYRYAGQWLRDANGAIVAPSGFGLIAIQGLEWQMIGPISANPDQRELFGIETACTAMVGQSIYCSVYSAGYSFIFHGTPKRELDLTPGPITWHGPIGALPGEVTDLVISTVGGKHLWAYCTGETPVLYRAPLTATFEPVPGALAGFIYFPDAVFDGSSPGVIKDVRKVEYTYPTDYPYDAVLNRWELEVWDPDAASWVAPATETGATATARAGWFTSQRRYRRTRARLRYATSDPLYCGLEKALIRVVERPERTRIIRVQIQLGATQTARMPERTVEDDVRFLRALANGGRAATVSLDQRRTFQAVVIACQFRQVTRPDNYVVTLGTVELYEVGLDAQEP